MKLRIKLYSRTVHMLLLRMPRRVFFMPWAELVKESNSVEQIKEIYHLPGVITRDEMPGWK